MFISKEATFLRYRLRREMFLASLENFDIFRHFHGKSFEERESKTFQPIFINFEIGRASNYAWEMFQGRTPIGDAPIWDS